MNFQIQYSDHGGTVSVNFNAPVRIEAIKAMAKGLVDNGFENVKVQQVSEITRVVEI